MEMSQAYPKMETGGLNYSPYRKGKGSFKREGLRGMPPCLCEIFTIMTADVDVNNVRFWSSVTKVFTTADAALWGGR